MEQQVPGSAGTGTRHPGGGTWIPLALGLGVLLVAFALPLALSFHEPAVFDCGGQRFFACFTGKMRELGPWGIALSLLTMILAALTMFPGEAAAMANGAVYGALWGTVLSWAGGMIGANIAFAAARVIGRNAIGLLLSQDHYERIRAWSARAGPIALMTARLIPLFPFFAVNYTAGLIAMRWWPFNWISAIGMLPAAITFSTMGAKAGTMSWLNWVSALAGILLAIFLVARFARWLVARRADPGP